MSRLIYKWDAQQTNEQLQQKYVGIYKWTVSIYNETTTLENETASFINE